MTEENSTFSSNLLQRAGSKFIGTTQKNIGSGSQLMIFVISTLLYIYFDFILGRFDGINLVRVFQSGELFYLLKYGMLLNAPCWIVMVVVFLIKRPENKDEFISKLALVSTYYFVLMLAGIIQFKGIILGQNNIVALIHIIVIIFIRRSILLNKFSTIDANYYTIIILFIDFFSFNLLHAFFPASAIVSRAIIPVLPYVCLFFMDDSRFRTIMLILISIFYIIVFMNTYRVSTMFVESLPEAQKQEAINKMMDFKDWIYQIPNMFMVGWNDNKKVLSGDYYTGQVEQNQNIPLGVFLEEFKPSDDQFVLGSETISVWGTLRAYTLDDQKISIKLSCYAKDGKNLIEGTLSPSNYFSIESNDEQFIQCTFDDNKFDKTSYYRVYLNATFNFKTQSYLKSYYIEKERKKVLEREGKNILLELGIANYNPTAIFTNGPIKMGMGTSKPPIGVDPIDFYSSFGITLDHNWNGNVNKIEELYISIPEGLKFVDDCSYFENTKDKKGFNYRLSEKERAGDNKKSYKLPKSYKCPIELDGLKGYNTLLGSSPLSIKYFKAETEYTYMISEKTSINIRKEATNE